MSASARDVHGQIFLAALRHTIDVLWHAADSSGLKSYELLHHVGSNITYSLEVYGTELALDSLDELGLIVAEHGNKNRESVARGMYDKLPRGSITLADWKSEYEQ